MPVLRHALAGLLAALVVSVGELIAIEFRAESVRFGPLLGAFFVLFGWLAPLLVVMGAGIGLLEVLFARTRWLASFRLGARHLISARTDPERFASVFATACGALALVGVMRVAVDVFQENFHSAAMIAWAIALSALPALLAAVIAAAFVQWAATWLGRAIGSLASPRGAIFILLGGALGVLAFFSQRLADIDQSIALAPYAWPFAVVIAYLLMLLVVLRIRRRGWVFGVTFAIALGTLAISAFAYDGARGTRRLVEQGSIGGQRLLRFYAGISDRDGDGHAAFFGGGDCDDGDASIHPDAPDPPGDGIDSDCFGGDGAPDVRGVMGDGAYAGTPSTTRKKNVLLIMIDALRPDHLGAQGYERETSPRIDAFADEAVVFENAIASSSRSVRSIPSMFTGLYAGQIEYGAEYLYPSVKLENELLAEVAQREGYQTVACMGTDYFSRVGHFFQGFDEVTQPAAAPREEPARCGIAALDELATGFTSESEPFFLWVHHFNVHLPYLPDRVASRFGPEPMDQYDTEITLADREVGRMLDALHERGLDEDTIVVLFSDHGEAFDEHGNRGHSTTLYEEEVRSTLMIRAPGIAPRRVSETVGMVDLAPTIRDLVGWSGRPQIAGRSLVPWLRGRSPDWSTRPLFMELLPDGLFPYDQKAVRIGDDKLMWWVRDGTTMLSDLAADPAESRDHWEDHPERAEAMMDTLRAWTAMARPGNDRRVVASQHLLDHVPPMDHRLALRFDGFEVLGLDLPSQRVHREGTIPATFYYRVDERVDEDLFFYVDLRDDSGRPFHDFHAHHFPLNGSFRTPEWRPGQIIADPIEIVVPRDVGLGEWTFSLSVLDERRQPLVFRHGAREGRTESLPTITVLPAQAE